MKKRLFIGLVLALTLLFASLAGAQLQLVGPSTEKSADASITTGQGYFHGVLIGCASGVTVDIYDNTSAAGRKLIPTQYFPGSATNQTHSIDMGTYGVFYNTGVYVDVTTSGTLRYMVYFTPK